MESSVLLADINLIDKDTDRQHFGKWQVASGKCTSTHVGSFTKNIVDGWHSRSYQGLRFRIPDRDEGHRPRHNERYLSRVEDIFLTQEGHRRLIFSAPRKREKGT
jgi:hypothetical protein